MLKIISVCAVLATIGLIHQAQTCNEAVCGSIVSKCLLTQSCTCELKNCTCCKDCFSCLSYLYSECCSCVNMCPKPNETENALAKSSHVEEFPEPVPGLFNVLTEYPDEQMRWNSTTFPVDLDISQFTLKKEIKIHMQSAEQEVAPIKSGNIITLNCTVAYLSKCMSWLKCKSSCLSMGASSYRWFHNGCCECVGENCINYGINESRCRECLADGNEGASPLNDENFDYGEDDLEDYTLDTDNI